MDQHTLESAQSFLSENNISGWLLYDYLKSNPIFHKLVTTTGHVTRPVYLLIKPNAQPSLIVHHVDISKFINENLDIKPYSNRTNMITQLEENLKDMQILAMEYSKSGQLPRISRVDAGTIELISELGPKVISSADLVQFTTQTWTDSELDSHIEAGRLLGIIVNDAFKFIGTNLNNNLTEYDVANYIRDLFVANNLVTNDGPVVAANENSADPHYEPELRSHTLKSGDWILIDLWAKLNNAQSIYADITWVAYIGNSVPENYQHIFNIVVEARNKSLEFLKSKFANNEKVQGWEVDDIARDTIQQYGYLNNFTHRLGHSIGYEVHSEGVNLDNWETHDTREIIKGIGFSIEPGIYISSQFGMRSEIDVYISDEGPVASSPVQNQIVLIR